MVKQSGNVLFLILIAVVLFAALSYAVTQSSRGGGNVNSENVAIAAAQIVQYIASVENGLTRVRVVNGCDIANVSFEHANWSHTNYEHSPVTDDKCKIFHPSGGGVTYQNVPDGALHSGQSAVSTYGEYFYSGGIWIYQADDTDVDLTMHVPHITEEVCMEIQDKMGVTGAFQAYGSNWLGTLSAANMVYDGGFANQHSWNSSRQYSCLQLAGSDQLYDFYYVLVDQ